MNPFRFDSVRGRSEAEYWNDPAIAADLQARQSGFTEFASDVEVLFPREARVLDLGCGAGDDSAYFAEHGHDVTALDISVPLVEMAAARYADHEHLDFRVADITQPLGVSGQSFDVVYARWSLHYFNHATTMRLFGEIAWVLRPGGTFYFGCRSTEDPLYGKGDEIEPRFFELGGHYRHFFDEDYAYELLEENGFTNIETSTGKQKLYGFESAYVKGIATAV